MAKKILELGDVLKLTTIDLSTQVFPGKVDGVHLDPYQHEIICEILFSAIQSAIKVI